MKNSKYLIKYHITETEHFKFDSSRPLVKRVFEETYELDECLVLEEIEEMLDVPQKRYEFVSDLDFLLRNSFADDGSAKKFIDENNRLFDFWQRVKPQIKEWMVLFANRKYSNFKHFTINLDEISWINHNLDDFDNEDSAYIDIKKL